MSSYINETTYNTDPKFQGLRNEGVSYEEFNANRNLYLSKLSVSSIMDLAKKYKDLRIHLNLGNTNSTSIFFQKKVEEADTAKTNAEKDYYTALAAEQAAGTAKDTAEAEYKKAMTTYENGGSEFELNKAYKNYNLAKSSERSWETTRKNKGEAMVWASKKSANACSNSIMADKISPS